MTLTRYVIAMIGLPVLAFAMPVRAAPVAPATAYDFKRLKGEALGRGIVAVRKSESEVAVLWRYLMSDPTNIAFNVYRDGQKVNGQPLDKATHFIDKFAWQGKAVTYEVRPIGLRPSAPPREIKTNEWVVPADAPIGFIEIPLPEPPPNYTLKDGSTGGFWPNDCACGDLDGDGAMEFVMRWMPQHESNNSMHGFTGLCVFDAIKVPSGELMWRVSVGPNFRAGKHYNPFLVADLDGDGHAEFLCKTADGSVDGQGKTLGDGAADWVDPEHGLTLAGPEFLTVFDGATGRAVDTIEYQPGRGDVESWGDGYGNRSERYLATTAYLDGEHLSAVFTRGYYARTALWAVDFDGRRLTTRWLFDTAALDPSVRGAWEGQGFHSLRTADVDFDGKDEIMFGSMTVDDDGTGLYSSGLGHGDALNILQLDPFTPGLAIWTCHENCRDGAVLRESRNGRILLQVESGRDVPRAVAGDLDPATPGTEFWAGSGIGLYDRAFQPHGMLRGIGWAFVAKWDADMTSAFVNWDGLWACNATTGQNRRIVEFADVGLNNGTKGTPAFQGDVLGDWREEILMRRNDNRALRLYVNTQPARHRFWTFLQDPVYRHGVNAQNAGYNQPPQPGFYFGPDLLGHGFTFRGTVLE